MVVVSKKRFVKKLIHTSDLSINLTALQVIINRTTVSDTMNKLPTFIIAVTLREITAYYTVSQYVYIIFVYNNVNPICFIRIFFLECIKITLQRINCDIRGVKHLSLKKQFPEGWTTFNQKPFMCINIL